MRWDTLTPQPSQPVLPLPMAGAVVRTFDTPGFAGMTFYEVRAKSVINRVPAASRMFFDWTVNPYRGCSHACAYCLAGDTPILMADGRTRPLAELRVGDRIYGTVRAGSYRQYALTEVLAHWSTVKQAYRLTLEDGTRLVASGDHRLLSSRGWKHVADLGPADRLMGVGGLPEPPKESVDYRRGYLVGTSHGERELARFHRRRVRRTLVDTEPLDRVVRYRAELGADIPALADSLDWCKGYLAGRFDAGGGLRGDDLAERCLRRLGLGAGSGARERLRFVLATEPAIVRKRSIEGADVRADAPLRVAAVEPLGFELPMFDITTGTGDFIANGIVSHNCFARNTHTYLDLDAGRDFDTRVVVKVNAGELLRKELAAPRWRGGHIAMGTNVDCYQRAEGRYRLMPQIIAALRDFANPFSILTKGTLIRRDLPLLRQAAEVTDVSLAFSVGFVDERVWRSVESGTPSPRRRLETVRAFADAGFAVSVLMAPILPGLTDTDESIEATVAAIARSGAASVTPLPLHLRPGAREWYMAWLARELPELLPRYRRLYGRGSYAQKAYQDEVVARVRAAARRHGLDKPRAGDHRRVPDAREESTPPPEQLSLL